MVAVLVDLFLPIGILKMLLVVGLLVGVAIMTVSAVDEPSLSAVTRKTKAWLLGAVMLALMHLFLGIYLPSRGAPGSSRIARPIFSIGALGRLPVFFVVLVLMALIYVYSGGSQTNPEERDWIPSNSDDRE